MAYAFLRYSQNNWNPSINNYGFSIFKKSLHNLKQDGQLIKIYNYYNESSCSQLQKSS